MRRLRPLILFALASLASAANALTLLAPPGPKPVVFGGNLPQVNRFSPESDWGIAGGLAGWGLTGRVARIPAISWAIWPEGFRGGQVDTNQIIRQMEVARNTSGTLVLLSPSEFPKSGDWVPPKEDWPAALAATKTMIGGYDSAAKRFGMPPSIFQLWNETSPGKPGGAKSGPPGEFDPLLHEYLAYLTKGLGIVPGSAYSRRFVGPAYSNLTDSAEAAIGEMASGSSVDGYWERRVGAIALHLRLPGYGLSPERYEARVTEIIDRNVDLVRSLPYWRGKNPDVWITEAYVTPGDIGRPDLDEGSLAAWRLAALRGAARSKAAAFLPYGLAPSVIEGDGGPWARFGGWAATLAGSEIEAFAKTARK